MEEITRGQLLYEAREIAESYAEDGLDLTLRQLYYQLVSRAIIPNGQKHYTRLGDTISNARMDGSFAIDLLVDRGRNARSSSTEEKLSVEKAMDRLTDVVQRAPLYFLSVEKWALQPKYVSVWVEKEALAGVFEGICRELGVGLFACKGYPSHSALWQWLKGLNAAGLERKALFEEKIRSSDPDYTGLRAAFKDGVTPFRTGFTEARILYFGDHDPDGWQIPRSALDTLNHLADLYGADGRECKLESELPPIRMTRVGLNMDQITRYKPPPFPAKETSSRYESYAEEHGTKDAWELDALKPEVLRDLIRKNVETHFDANIEGVVRGQLALARAKMASQINQEWVSGLDIQG